MTSPVRQNIALFGGSFNPIHTGHMMVAQYVAQFTDIDCVWMLVSPSNPLKTGLTLAPDRQRLEMVEISCAGNHDIRPDDFEFALPQPSYTYNTLRKLSETYPDFKFTLLIGADNWLIFDKWREWEKILANYDIMIYPRPGCEIDTSTLPPSVRYLSSCPQCSVSSTFIRNAIKSGRDVSHFLPHGVYSYILEHNLY